MKKKLNCLSDLVEAKDEYGLEVSSFVGHTIVTQLGNFMLAGDTLYLNGEVIQLANIAERAEQFKKEQAAAAPKKKTRKAKS